MTRVKRGVTSIKRRRNILSQVKGYRFGRSTKERQAKDAIAHAGSYAFAHRRDKKNDRRTLWQIHINAAVRDLGGKYSTFISGLRKSNILVDRKILSDLASSHPETFKKIFEKVK